MEIPETHKPQNGNPGRTYHDFVLSNNNTNLKCCVISDPTSEKAAAAMTVNVGQLQDPSNGHGIAHLTEHMLFMGSTKFPGENDYDSYLSANGGYHNAYTDLELTNYYLECSAKVLPEALDRFANGFTSPLLKAESIEREVNAVDSEHGKNKQQDHWRLHQLSRTVMGNMCVVVDNNNNDTNDSHPYASFGTGNKATLLECTGNANENENEKEKEHSLAKQQVQALQQKVEAFYKRYYKAENMALAVMGNQSVEELQALVEQYFSDLPVIQDPAINVATPVTLQLQASSASSSASSSNSTKSLPAVIEVVPIRKESQSVELQWIIPAQKSLYRSKPARFFSHLLGHEGPGSLLAVLRELHWAQELYADDASKNCEGFSIFTVNIDLTSEGLNQLSTVLQTIFYYIQNVCKTIPDWVYEELKVMGETQFRFLSKLDAADTTSGLACQMQTYPAELYLAGPYQIYESNAQAVHDVWECLANPHQVLILVSSIQFQGKTDQVDPWYGTQYRIVTTAAEDPEHELLTNLLDTTQTLDPAIAAKLQLPERNDMLPSNFDLLDLSKQPHDIFQQADASLPPHCLMDTDVCRLWYKPDTANFHTPKFNLMALIKAPTACGSNPQNAVLAKLYGEVLQEICNEFSYAASMAGLHCGFYNSTSSQQPGIEIQVSGYNHKAGILVQRICNAVNNDLPKQLKENPGLFERVRTKVEEQFHGFIVGQPYQHGPYIVDMCLEVGNKWSVQDRLEYLKEITCDDFLYFCNHLLTRFEMEVLVHGNVTAKEAVDYTNIFLEAWKPKPLLHSVTNRIVELPAGKECVYKLDGLNEENDNSCVVNLYQIGKVDLRTNAVISLLNHLIREPTFNTLRTEEQLGYIVFSSVKTSGEDVKSFMFLIQSDSFDPEHMDSRIEAFLTSYRTTKLNDMSDEEFQSHVDATREMLLEKNKNLFEESSKHWQAITKQTYHFQRLQDIAEHVKDLTKDDVLNLFDKYMSATSADRRKLSVQLFGKNHPLPTPPQTTEDSTSLTENTILRIDDPSEFARVQRLYPAPERVSIESFLLTP